MPTPMNLTLRAEKGAPLTHDEMDANFLALASMFSGDDRYFLPVMVDASGEPAAIDYETVLCTVDPDNPDFTATTPQNPSFICHVRGSVIAFSEDDNGIVTEGDNAFTKYDINEMMLVSVEIDKDGKLVPTVTGGSDNVTIEYYEDDDNPRREFDLKFTFDGHNRAFGSVFVTVYVAEPDGFNFEEMFA
ncbi:hypothetical protein [Nitratifractor sp.]